MTHDDAMKALDAAAANDMSNLFTQLVSGLFGRDRNPEDLFSQGVGNLIRAYDVASEIIAQKIPPTEGA